MQNKMAILGEGDSVLAFKAAGVDAYYASEREEAKDLLRKLGKDTNTTFESLQRDLGKKEGVKPKEPKIIEQKSSGDGVKNAERLILCAMLFPFLNYVFYPAEGFITLSAFCIGAMVDIRQTN